MSIEQPEDLAGMRRAGEVVRDTLAALSAAVRPGVTTLDLDRVAQRVFDRYGARSAPRDHLGFPGTVLISVNDEAVHGIPGRRRLEPGDVVSLDVTPELGGYIADAATTLVVPPASWEGTASAARSTSLRTSGTSPTRSSGVGCRPAR